MTETTQKKRLHILLAEDNPGDRLLVDEALRHHGLDFTLSAVDDVDKASDYLKRIGKFPDALCPDVMLVDLNLPKASGFELVQMFRSHPDCPPAPLIIMTSSDAPSDRQMAAELGAAYYFRKPSDLDDFMELGRIVREVLEKNEPGALERPERNQSKR